VKRFSEVTNRATNILPHTWRILLAVLRPSSWSSRNSEAQKCRLREQRHARVSGVLHPPIAPAGLDLLRNPQQVSRDNWNADRYAAGVTRQCNTRSRCTSSLASLVKPFWPSQNLKKNANSRRPRHRFTLTGKLSCLLIASINFIFVITLKNGKQTKYCIQCLQWKKLLFRA
jgi:hypothetical protein